MYQVWTAEMSRSFSKGKKIRVNESYREKQNNAVNRSQQKERKNTNTNDDSITPSTRDKIENLQKDLKFIKETLKAMISQ